MPGSAKGIPTRNPSISFFSRPASLSATAVNCPINFSGVTSGGASFHGFSSAIPIAAALPLRLMLHKLLQNLLSTSTIQSPPTSATMLIGGRLLYAGPRGQLILISGCQSLEAEFHSDGGADAF